MKKIISAAQLGLINAMNKCDQYHTFVDKPYNDALKDGIIGDAMVTAGGYAYESVGNGQLYSILEFDNKGFWCGTYDYQSTDNAFYFGLVDPWDSAVHGWYAHARTDNWGGSKNRLDEDFVPNITWNLDCVTMRA